MFIHQWIKSAATWKSSNVYRRNMVLKKQKKFDKSILFFLSIFLKSFAKYGMFKALYKTIIPQFESIKTPTEERPVSIGSWLSGAGDGP